MKTLKLNTTVCALLILAMASCTNNNRSGSNMSEEGTTQSNRVNAEMEEHRTPSDIDSIVSPGSNALDHKNRDGETNSSAVDNSNTNPSVTPGSGKDHNMAGQSDTHGKSTTAGDK